MERRRGRGLATRAGATVAVFALLVVGVGFRVYHLDRKVYEDDEVYTSLRIAGYTRAEVSGQREALSATAWLRFQTVGPDASLPRVLRALVDDVHPPLYFLLTWQWAWLFGSSPWTLRLLSALISVLAFPCLYWFGRELVEEASVTRLALVLFAVSPVHVLYAQEARQYSLWVVTVLASCAALLRAMRTGSWPAWLLYAIACAAALYTHYLSVVVIAGQAVYVLAVVGVRRCPALVRFTAAAGLAGLAFVPWLLIADRIGGAGYTRRRIPVAFWLERWLMNAGCLFFDPQIGRPGMLFDAGAGRDVGLGWGEPSAWVLALFAMLAVYLLYRLWREAAPRTRLFLATLIGVLVAFLTVPDIVKGGQRSTIPRYLIPAYLGVGLAAAHGLARRIRWTPEAAWRAWAWRAALAAVLTAGVGSCLVSAEADTWWTKYQAYPRAEVARVVNRTAAPLVLVGGPIPLLGLSHLAHAGVTLQLARSFSPPPPGFADVFVYDPSPAFQAGLAQQAAYRMVPLDGGRALWRLEAR